MKYPGFLILQTIFLLISLSWILAIPDGKKIFARQVKKAIIFTFIIGAVLGVLGLFVHTFGNWNIFFLHIIFQVLFFIMGYIHLRMLEGYYLFPPKYDVNITLPYTLFLGAVASLALFIVFWMVERPFFKENNGIADNISLSVLAAFLPYFVYLAHTYWNKIPIVIKEMIPWEINLEQPPPILEPGNIQLTFEIPLSMQSDEVIKKIVAIQPYHSLGDIFYNVLNDHNIKKRSPKQIEIAEQKSRSKVYKWLFYKIIPKKRRFEKDYLDPSLDIKSLGLGHRDVIYVERVKTW